MPFSPGRDLGGGGLCWGMLGGGLAWQPSPAADGLSALPKLLLCRPFSGGCLVGMSLRSLDLAACCLGRLSKQKAD